jgi:hypothetical protein
MPVTRDNNNIIIIIIIIYLAIEIQCIWSARTGMIPITIRATGTTSKSFRKYLNNIPEEHDIEELQQTATQSTLRTYFGQY